MLRGSQQLGCAQAQAQPQPQSNTVGAHIEGLDRQLGRLGDQLKMLRNIADSLAGTRPPPIATCEPSDNCEPVSHLARLADRRAALASLVDQITEEILRISEAL